MRIVSGNLLDFPERINVICHQANINNKFGAGLAKQIKERYPVAYKVDSEAYKKGLAVLGSYTYAKLRDNKYIFNCYAQDLYEKSLANIPTSYDAIYSSLMCVKGKLYEIHHNNEEFIPHIGFPYKMGCGLGGGNWEIYKKIIDECIGNSFTYDFIKFDG